MVGKMFGDQVLLVEGEDDEHVVKQLRKACGIEPNFGIEEQGGYPKLRAGITGHVKRSGLRTLGIMVDADDHVETRWQELVDELAKEGVELPATPASAGTLIDGSPRIGIWLMPDNRTPGELEDFVRTLIPAGDVVWPLARQYIAGIPKAHRRFKLGKVSKAEVYAWLASLEQPQRMGAAIGAEDLDRAAPLASGLARWLSELFGE